MVREQIRAVIEAVARELELDPGENVRVEMPRDRTHGDFSTNVALVLARQAGVAPRQLAEKFAERLRARSDLQADVSLAGPGFINFKLHGSPAAAALGELLGRGTDFSNDSGRGTRLQLEFVSANPTGPLNVVSARAAAYGSTLAAMLRACGYDVETEFYSNDAGTQVDLLGASVRARWLEHRGEAFELPEEGYRGDYVADLAAAVPEESARGWQELPDAEAARAFGGWAVDRILESQQRDLERFAVRFERWFRESELHRSGEVQTAERELRDAGHAFDQDGAVYFRSTQWGDDKDRVLVRSDGSPTYFLADAAYHRNKQERGFQHVIDVWGPDHHGHIARMQALCSAFGYAADWLEIVIVQWVNLVEGGRTVKMSKRAGSLVTLGDLVEEVGSDVARYFFLMRQQTSHLDFDLELARKHSDENPVYYVKYAHARICSVIARARQDGLEVAAADPPEPVSAAAVRLEDVALERLEGDAERQLVKLLIDWPGFLQRAAEAREPHRLTGYCEDLARAFHKFYHEHRVIQEDRELALARLALCHATRLVLASALGLMSIEAPVSM